MNGASPVIVTSDRRNLYSIAMVVSFYIRSSIDKKRQEGAAATRESLCLA
jgi:hypothetical protein